MKITFYGAAQNVTGSNYLLDINGSRVLVDCGFYQERELRNRNFEPFEYKALDIDAVLLTHAHLDHCGLLPKLVKHGFKGKIFCTPATADIAQIVMTDSARIQEEDIKHKKRRHERQNRESPYPYEPLYTVEDAEAVPGHMVQVEYGVPTTIVDGLQCTFKDAGHILGSSQLHLELKEADKTRTLVFSGDMGRWDTPLLCDPEMLDTADYVVTESTYGNRTHKPNEEIPDIIARIVNQTVRAGGKVVVPSFAVERSQELMFHLNNLLRDGRIPQLPVYLDSPMAVRVTEVFRRHPELMDEETTAMMARGDHPCNFPGLMLSRTVDESRAINADQTPAVIIAGSGMCTGGRIKHHLKHQIDRRESTLMFVGYQAKGTLGRILLSGVETVRLHGETYNVDCRIEKVNGFSAHGDRTEIFKWLSSLKEAPRKVFVTHGEAEAAQDFSEYIRLRTQWNVAVPSYTETHELE